MEAIAPISLLEEEEMTKFLEEKVPIYCTVTRELLIPTIKTPMLTTQMTILYYSGTTKCTEEQEMT